MQTRPMTYSLSASEQATPFFVQIAHVVIWSQRAFFALQPVHAALLTPPSSSVEREHGAPAFTQCRQLKTFRHLVLRRRHSAQEAILEALAVADAEPDAADLVADLVAFAGPAGADRAGAAPAIVARPLAKANGTRAVGPAWPAEPGARAGEGGNLAYDLRRLLRVCAGAPSSSPSSVFSSAVRFLPLPVPLGVDWSLSALWPGPRLGPASGLVSSASLGVGWTMYCFGLPCSSRPGWKWRRAVGRGLRGLAVLAGAGGEA